MVLGAGLGTRLRPFTERLPKPLFPVLGVSCIELAFLHLRSSGVSEVTVNLHAHADLLEDWLDREAPRGLLIRKSNERARLLGSAGGYRKALPLIGGERFFSMNADVIHFPDLNRLEEAHFRARRDHGALMTLVINTGRALQGAEGEYREILLDEARGLIRGFGEKRTGVPFYSGTAIFEKEAFSSLKEGEPAEFVPSVLDPAIRSGKVAFICSESLWIDIGSPRLWAEAQTRLRQAREGKGIPASIDRRLEAADPSWGGRIELGKTSIRMDDIVYEIEDLRNF